MTESYDFSKPIHYCAGAFIIRENKILFLKQDKTHYLVLPGGHVEENEFPHEAAIREVREETGLEIELLQKPDQNAKTGIVEPLPLPFAMRAVPCKDKKDIDILFTAKITGGTLKINEESREAIWLSLEQINQNPVVGPSLKYYANQILKKRGLSLGDD